MNRNQKLSNKTVSPGDFDALTANLDIHPDVIREI